MTSAVLAMDSVVVGKSARMRAVFEFLRVIGNSESTVLITGESGTGKEVTATLIHQSSRRKHKPFVAVSCALFSETLIESDLFGHERGAFTGAVKDRPGRFELADGGTIFLDDIDAVRQAFTRYNWPGNVRELENACERIAQTCTCGTVRIGCMAAQILFRAGSEPIDAAVASPAPVASAHPMPVSLDDRLRELESNLILWALNVSNGNKSKAAELLQIKRSTLGDRITRCGLRHDPESTSTPDMSGQGN